MKIYGYKTRRQDYSYMGGMCSLLCLISCIIYGISLKTEERYVLWLLIIAAVICIYWFIYSITCNTKRRIYKKKGKRFSGVIIGAEEERTGRGSNTYYLLISFYDEHRRIKYTEGYVGDPNYYLISRKCSIYKYNGEYIEADLVPGKFFNEASGLGISITKYKKTSKNRYV